jgi:mannose-6-phosphate isomerase
VPVPAVFALDGVMRDYAWGSTTVIQQLLGRKPDGRPAAELWFGAHPDDPAPVPSLGTTLDKVIEADLDGVLGSHVVEQFGPRLPFLLKVLAANKALSIQVHPNLEQARAGFAAEDAAGIAREAPERNYRDTNHKPELLCALTPFDALCGFRPVGDTLRLLDALAVPALDDVRRVLMDEGGLRAAFTQLLTMPDPADLVATVVAAAAGLTAEWAGVARAVTLAGSDFPGDVGAVLALLLNAVRLQPGEAIYLGAGNVHAYLRGTGVEIMANSDNVLRCGLTPKHVDVEELLKITDFRELAEPRWPATGDDSGAEFNVPVPDFALSSTDIAANEVWRRQLAGPSIVLCNAGSVRVEAGGGAVVLAPGHAAFVLAEQRFTASGSGHVFVATTGSVT